MAAIDPGASGQLGARHGCRQDPLGWAARRASSTRSPPERPTSAGASGACVGAG